MIYYASKISGNMAKTPEGFLICQNVPIARIGKQEYLTNELPIEQTNPNEAVVVHRDSEDVFDPAAMASFEGKPVTNEHPNQMLNPENISNQSKGSAQNIRRSGKYVVADLIIYDATLIHQIENGKREVSCGYNAHYEWRDGKLYQTNIEGNHIAVVESGRAGEKVAIKDSTPQPTKPERRNTMSKNKKNTRPTGVAGAMANIMSFFSQDSSPQDIAEAVEELVEAVKEETVAEEYTGDDDTPEGYEPYHKLLYDALVDMNGKLDYLVKEVEEIKNAEYVSVDKDPLAQLEAELMEDEGEEAVINDPEIINEQIDNEYTLVEAEEMHDQAGVVMPKAGRPTNPLDSKAALEEIAKMKPIIASIKDAKQRKAMTDSMTNMIRKTYGLSPQPRGKGNGYANIQRAANHQAQYQKDHAKNKKPDLAVIQAKIEADRLGKR